MVQTYKNFCFNFIVVSFFASFFTPHFAWSAEEYEELNYNDLVKQLSYKKDPFWKNSPANEQTMIHAGFGLVTTTSQIRYPDQVRSRPLNGFQMSLGIDLLSTTWMGELLFRNFANHSSGTETRSLRELDWRVVNRLFQAQKVEMRIGAGFGNRTYKLNDSNGSGFEQDSIVGLVSLGVETALSKTASLGIEGGIRSALITNSNDINSVDLAFKVESQF